MSSTLDRQMYDQASQERDEAMQVLPALGHSVRTPKVEHTLVLLPSVALAIWTVSRLARHAAA